MNFTVINTLILLGVVQGFVFGVLYLFSKEEKNKSTFFLMLLIVFFSYNNLQFYLIDSKIIRGSIIYRTLYIPVGSLFPVFIYFYILESTIGVRNRFKKPWLFYIPFLLFFSNTIFYKIYSLSTTMTANIYMNFRDSNSFQSVFSFIYTLVLIILSYKHLTNHEKQYSLKKERKYEHYNWLKKTLIILFFLSLFWFVALFMYLTNKAYTIYFNLLWLGLSVVIYWLGHLGIYKYEVIQERKKIRTLSSTSKLPLIIDAKTSDNIDVIKNKLIREQLFLDSKLTLESLANEIGVSKSHLSRIFNNELNKSFSDYIKELRVKKAVTYLENPKFLNYTIVAIGLEAGFNSKTTFNTAFKKITGVTPSEYRKSNLSTINITTTTD